MTKRLLAAVVLLCGSMFVRAQATVAPIINPHVTFVDNSGSPCVGCLLYSYIAGTTTPTPTYTDSLGISQNTNPIVLSTSGGANIWPDTSIAYKFTLKTAQGSTLWTVDNVKGGFGGTPCSTPYSVQIASSDAKSLACDPTITIDPLGHIFEVGGVIGATPHFNLQNINTIPTTWTFDVTTPATALASLGPISPSNLGNISADSVLMNATGSAAPPAAVAFPNCSTGITYDTTAHTLGCYTAAIPLTRLASQAADTVVLNATGSSAAPTAVALPNCATGLTYDTTGHALGCVTGTTRVCNSNGCYRTYADGTIEQWGVSNAFPTGADTNTVAVTFPTAFTTTTNLSVTGTADNCANTCSGKNPLVLTMNGAPSTSGVTFSGTGSVPTGGGGDVIVNTVHVHWHAIGN